MGTPPADMLARCLTVAAVLFSGAALSSPDCDKLKNCASCLNTSSWWPGSHCNWCPIDSQCHAAVSAVNPCSKDQYISNTSKCSASDPPTGVHLGHRGLNQWFSQVWHIGASPGPDSHGSTREALPRRCYLPPFGHLRLFGMGYRVLLSGGIEWHWMEQPLLVCNCAQGSVNFLHRERLRRPW